MGIESAEGTPSGAGSNFKAPETGGLSIDRESMYRVEAKAAARRAEHYRAEAKKAKSAKERYELNIQARAEQFFADNPQDDVSMMRAFEEENPKLFEEWKKVTHQMTPEEIEQAKKDLGEMTVS